MQSFSAIAMVFLLLITASGQVHMANDLFSQGTLAARGGAFSKAVQKYKRALFYIDKNEPGGDLRLARTYSNIGVCLYRMEQYNAAESEFRKAIDLSHGRYQPALYGLGMTQFELGKLREALIAFRRATELRGSDGEAWFDLGSTSVLLKDYGGAEEAFRNAVRFVSVARPEARNNLGVLLAWKGDLAAAESEFRAALAEAGGEMPEAQNNLRLCRELHISDHNRVAGEFRFGTRRDRKVDV